MAETGVFRELGETGGNRRDGHGVDDRGRGLCRCGGRLDIPHVVGRDAVEAVGLADDAGKGRRRLRCASGRA